MCVLQNVKLKHVFIDAFFLPVDHDFGDPKHRKRGARNERWPGLLQPTDRQTHLHGDTQVEP